MNVIKNILVSLLKRHWVNFVLLKIGCHCIFRYSNMADNSQAKKKTDYPAQKVNKKVTLCDT